MSTFAPDRRCSGFHLQAYALIHDDATPSKALDSPGVRNQTPNMTNHSTPLTPFALPLKRAAAVAQLSPDMVDYLCKRKIIVPTGQAARGRGKPRLYTFADLVLLRAVSNILKGGVSVAKLGAALQNFEAQHGPITPEKLPGRYLFTDGNSIYIYNKFSDAVEDLTNFSQLTFGFFVNLEETHSDVLQFLNPLSNLKSAPLTSSNPSLPHAASMG